MGAKQKYRFIALYTLKNDKKAEKLDRKKLYEKLKKKAGKNKEKEREQLVYRWWKDTDSGKISEMSMPCILKFIFVNQRDEKVERIAFLDPITGDQIGIVAKASFIRGRDYIGYAGKPYTLKVESEVAELMGLSMTHTYAIENSKFKNSPLQKVFAKPQTVINIENLIINK